MSECCCPCFLRDDLYLSDESDGEQEIDPIIHSPNIAAGRLFSPVGAPPAIHDSRSAVNIKGRSLPQIKNLFSSESGSERDTTNDDSVEEYVTSVRVPKMLSPLGATPPIHNPRSDLNLNKGTSPQARKQVYASMPIIKPLLSSSSESDSESNSDNDDSDEKKFSPAGLSRLESTPAEHASTYTKPEEESSYRWNLASFCYLNYQSSVTSAPPITTSLDSGKPPTEKSGSIISSFSEPDSDQGVDKQLRQTIVQTQQPSATKQSAPQHMRLNMTTSAARDSKNEVIPPITVEKVIYLVPNKVPDKIAKQSIEKPRKDPIVNDVKKVLKNMERKPNGRTSFAKDGNDDQRHISKFTIATLSDDDSSDDDSDAPCPGRRKQQVVTLKKNSGVKMSKWEEPKQKRHRRKCSDSVEDKKTDKKSVLKNRPEVEREKADSRTATIRKYGASSSISRKSRPSSSTKQPKSAEYVPSSYDSSSDTDTDNTVKTRPEPVVNLLRNSFEELSNKLFGPDNDFDISSKKTPIIKDIGIKVNKDKNEALKGIYLGKKFEGDKDRASSLDLQKLRPISNKKLVEPESAEYLPAHCSSSKNNAGNTVAERPKPKVNASRNSSEEVCNRLFGPDNLFDISQKKTSKMIDTDRKVNENKVAAGKNKNYILRKLFTPKRDAEGGKGGGKGANGKESVNVIIVDRDNTRNNSSMESSDLAITNSNRTKPTLAKNDPSPRNPTINHKPSIKPVKTEPVTPVKNMKPNERKRMPSWVEIDLDYLETTPTLRERFEQKMPWLFQSNVTESVNGKEEKQNPNEDSIPEINEKENKSKTVTKSQDGSSEHSDREHESLKRKRKHGSSSVSSPSTISNMPVQSKMMEHSYSHNSQHFENKDDYRKLKRQKEEGNQSHDSIHIGDHRDIAQVPCSQSRWQTENINSTGVPPCNNERVPMMRDTIRNPEYSVGTMAVIPIPPVGKTNVLPKFVRLEYHSHTEPLKELMDHEIRDKSQYLMEAVRLKKRAEREPDPIKQCMLYLEAVQYFLLTTHAMESVFLTDRVAFTMYRDTITQIQHIAATFRKPQNTSPVFQKLAVLSYRCQAVLFYKLFAMSMHDARKIQKRMGENCDKYLQNPVSVGGTAPLAEHHPHWQRQSTPPHLSPFPSPDSVGSIKSQSSGYNSDGAQTTPRGAGVWVPLPISNAMAQMHHHLGYLLSFQELWNMADNLVIKGNYTNFFNELDRSCKPLSMHSSIVDLVRYVRGGIRRLRYRTLL